MSQAAEDHEAKLKTRETLNLVLIFEPLQNILSVPTYCLENILSEIHELLLVLENVLSY